MMIFHTEIKYNTKFHKESWDKKPTTLYHFRDLGII